MPANLAASTSIDRNRLQSEYNIAVKQKDMEINAQMKSLIKDSMRISLKELGFIHYNYGFLQEANQ